VGSGRGLRRQPGRPTPDPGVGRYQLRPLQGHAQELGQVPRRHRRTNGYKVWGITINTPPDSPNTDGVDPSRAKNGVIAYTKISTGDDNIAVKGGGPNTVDGLLVAHNHFGRGHGMSIGSETNGGVRNVSVCDLSLDGTDNGLRIKSDASRGGLVQGVYYTDVCIRNSRHRWCSTRTTARRRGR
jgi:polygalacturonase